MADDDTTAPLPTGFTGRGRKAWITPEIRARMVANGELYAQQIETLHETGHARIRPRGEKVLLRAILKTDAMETGIDDYDMRQAAAFEIVDIGAGVPLWESDHGVVDGDNVKPGQHCFVHSACIDRLSKDDLSVRLCLVHVEDISAVWDPPSLAIDPK